MASTLDLKNTSGQSAARLSSPKSDRALAKLCERYLWKQRSPVRVVQLLRAKLASLRSASTLFSPPPRKDAATPACPAVALAKGEGVDNEDLD